MTCIYDYWSSCLSSFCAGSGGGRAGGPEGAAAGGGAAQAAGRQVPAAHRHPLRAR